MILATVVFTAVLTIALATSATAAPQVTVLGAAAPAQPSCPTSCTAVARTTGFQVSIGKVGSPFVAPYRGRLVAWSIKLGRPSAEDADFFTDEFGQAGARVSVLKPIMKKVKQGKPIYKLKSQSPVEQLSTYFGTTTTFALQNPLRVKRNNVVALTVPTWAPAFALGQGGNSIWQASRKRTRCATGKKSAEILADTKAGTAAEVIGANRAYGCVYKTARLLYSATIVKDPNASDTPPKKKKKGT